MAMAWPAFRKDAGRCARIEGMQTRVHASRTPTILYVDCSLHSGIVRRRLDGLRCYAAVRKWRVETLEHKDCTPAALREAPLAHVPVGVGPALLGPLLTAFMGRIGPSVADGSTVTRVTPAWSAFCMVVVCMVSEKVWNCVGFHYTSRPSLVYG